MIINSNPAKYLAGWANRRATVAYREIQEKTMTTAIEQAKREMYYALQGLKGRIEINYSVKDMLSGVDGFEISLEDYLEQLRQQYEEMASTAHQWFESIQSLEAANQDLLEQLAKMTESRDMFRNLHQAATHAAIERVFEGATVDQDSGDRGSCAKSEASEWNGEGLPPVGVACEAAIPHTSGPDNERSYIWIEGRVIAYFEIKGKTYAWFAEEDGFYPPNVLEFRPIRAPEQIAAEERERFISECSDFTSVTNDWREVFGMMYDANYRQKPSCMHSFFAIGSDQMECTFCGVGK